MQLQHSDDALPKPKLLTRVVNGFRLIDKWVWTLHAFMVNVLELILDIDTDRDPVVVVIGKIVFFLLPMFFLYLASCVFFGIYYLVSRAVIIPFVGVPLFKKAWAKAMEERQ